MDIAFVPILMNGQAGDAIPPAMSLQQALLVALWLRATIPSFTSFHQPGMHRVEP
jgi:hypothetical protein